MTAPMHPRTRAALQAAGYRIVRTEYLDGSATDVILWHNDDRAQITTSPTGERTNYLGSVDADYARVSHRRMMGRLIRGL